VSTLVLAELIDQRSTNNTFSFLLPRCNAAESFDEVRDRTEEAPSSSQASGQRNDSQVEVEVKQEHDLASPFHQPTSLA
jgi:hypothetical protein